MLEAVFEGVKLGLFLIALGFGPILFVIIDSTLKRGRWAGFLVSSGVYISDLMFISLYTVTTKWLEPILNHPYFKPSVGIMGFVVLVGFGLYTFFSAKEPIDQSASKSINGGFFLKGFLVNTLNPFTILFWFYTVNVSGQGFSKSDILLMALITVHMVLFSDLIKSYFSAYLKEFINSNKMVKLKQGIGLALIVFGFILIGRIIFS